MKIEKNLKFDKGFSLVELLVVIAIIGVLATMVLAALGNSRKTARDAKRINDLRQLRTAIDAYYLKKGVLPCSATSLSIEDQSHCLSLLVPKYIPALPVDPIYGGNGSADGDMLDYRYYHDVSNQANRYYLGVQFEDTDSLPVEFQHSHGPSRCADDSALPVAPWFSDAVYRAADCETVYYILGSQVTS